MTNIISTLKPAMAKEFTVFVVNPDIHLQS